MVETPWKISSNLPARITQAGQECGGRPQGLHQLGVGFALQPMGHGGQDFREAIGCHVRHRRQREYGQAGRQELLRGFETDPDDIIPEPKVLPPNGKRLLEEARQFGTVGRGS
jgi:hypothetical protein